MANKFKKSMVDGCWICMDCGVAITPTIDEVNTHLNECKRIEGKEKCDCCDNLAQCKIEIYENISESKVQLLCLDCAKVNQKRYSIPNSFITRLSKTDKRLFLIIPNQNQIEINQQKLC